MNFDNLFTFILGGLCAALAGTMTQMERGLPEIFGKLFVGIIILAFILGLVLSGIGSMSLTKSLKLTVITFIIGLVSDLLADSISSWLYLGGTLAVIYTATRITGPPPEPARRLSAMDPR